MLPNAVNDNYFGKAQLCAICNIRLDIEHSHEDEEKIFLGIVAIRSEEKVTKSRVIKACRLGITLV